MQLSYFTQLAPAPQPGANVAIVTLPESRSVVTSGLAALPGRNVVAGMSDHPAIRPRPAARRRARSCHRAHEPWSSTVGILFGAASGDPNGGAELSAVEHFGHIEPPIRWTLVAVVEADLASGRPVLIGPKAPCWRRNAGRV